VDGDGDLDAVAGPVCQNRLDAETSRPGHCDLLIREGHFSCEADFCDDCEGVIHAQTGAGFGGHQSHLCDLSCKLCEVTVEPMCQDAKEVQLLGNIYHQEDLPPGYIWETPYTTNLVGTFVVLIVNGLAAAVIAMKDHISSDPAAVPSIQMQADKWVMLAAAILVAGGSAFVVFSVATGALQIRDKWIFAYAVATGVSHFWGSRTKEPQRGFFPIALVPCAMQVILSLVFIGYDYCLGLFMLGTAYYCAGLVTVLSVEPWLGAIYYLLQLVLIDGILFWSSLLGLHWQFSSFLLILAAAFRLGASCAWVFSWSLEHKRPRQPETTEPGTVPRLRVLRKPGMKEGDPESPGMKGGDDGMLRADCTSKDLTCGAVLKAIAVLLILVRCPIHRAA
jgi:hypothetical protein